MILQSCKWATQVEKGTPYTVSEELLDKLNCQFYIHGDDPCYDAQGVELCGALDKVGRFKMIQRTSGVSTTDITGKLLNLAKAHVNGEKEEDQVKEAPVQKFLQTSLRVSNFSN